MKQDGKGAAGGLATLPSSVLLRQVALLRLRFSTCGGNMVKGWASYGTGGAREEYCTAAQLWRQLHFCKPLAWGSPLSRDAVNC